MRYYGEFGNGDANEGKGKSFAWWAILLSPIWLTVLWIVTERLGI